MSTECEPLSIKSFPSQDVDKFKNLFGYLPPIKRCRCTHPKYDIITKEQSNMIKELGKNTGNVGTWICRNCKGYKCSM